METLSSISELLTSCSPEVRMRLNLLAGAR